jgi:hypothetical protein
MVDENDEHEDEESGLTLGELRVARVGRVVQNFLRKALGDVAQTKYDELVRMGIQGIAMRLAQQDAHREWNEDARVALAALLRDTVVRPIELCVADAAACATLLGEERKIMEARERVVAPLPHDEGHPHLVNGEFQSDKYPTTPRGKVPLSVKDPDAQDLLWEYASRHEARDSEFAADLREALKRAGYERRSA